MTKFIRIIALISIAFTTGCGASALKKENTVLKAQLEASQAEQAKIRNEMRELETRLDPTKRAAPAPAPQSGSPALLPPVMGPQFGSPGLMMAQGGLVQSPIGGMIGPQNGYMSRNPQDGQPCAGMCMEVVNQYPGRWMAVFVDDRPQTIFAGYQPVASPANVALPGGGRTPGVVSAFPYGRSVKFVMDSAGNHRTTVVIYVKIPGNAVLQAEGVWDQGEVTFPIPNEPIGWKSNVYGPSRRIDTF